MWNIVAASTEKPNAHTNNVHYLYFMPEGRKAISGAFIDDGMKFWVPSTGDCLQTISSRKNGTRVDAVSEKSPTGDANQLNLLDIEIGSLIQQIEHNEE